MAEHEAVGEGAARRALDAPKQAETPIALAGGKLVGIEAEQGQLDARREELGLNRPIYVQYVDWMRRMVTLDMPGG